jgi:hypothetical protein
VTTTDAGGVPSRTTARPLPRARQERRLRDRSALAHARGTVREMGEAARLRDITWDRD